MTITTTIEHVVDIEAPPDRVFDLWTTVDGLTAWWGASATIDPRPGGPIRVDIDGEHFMVGEIVEIERPHRLVFRFGWEGREPAPSSTSVEVTIEGSATGSRVLLRHSGLPVEYIGSHAEGWTHFLGTRLRDAPA